ncbi:MAG: DUF503 domain-containing protein [Acidimicrobiales bacterium]
MHVAVVHLELHISTSRSLKEKRAVLRPIVEGIRHRFQISMAEVGYQDKWQRALIGMAVVSILRPCRRGGRQRRALGVEQAEVEVCRFEREWHGDGGAPCRTR